MNLGELRDAVCDLRYLLNRGYRRRVALDVVANRYRLPIAKRNFLVRAVFSQKEAEEHKSKLGVIKKIRGKAVAVDGYNVLITVEAGLAGDVFMCDDGFVRDAEGVFGKYKFKGKTKAALVKILDKISRHKPSSVLFVFDEKASYSGELAALARKELKNRGLRGEAITSPRTDYELGKYKVVCSSDRAIIRKPGKVIIDLPSYIVKAKRLPACQGE